MKDFARHAVRGLELEIRIDDVRNFAHTIDWVHGSELCMGLGRVHWRLDVTQRDRVYPDTALGILDRQRSGRAIESTLRQRREYGWYTSARIVNQARRDLHNMTATLLLHFCDRQLCHVKEASDVGTQIRLVVIVGVLGKWLGDEDASIVDERVNAPKSGHTFDDRTLSSFSMGNVA